MGNTNGDGSITGHNNKVSSLKIWNRSTLNHLCVTFYNLDYQDGRSVEYFVNKASTIATPITKYIRALPVEMDNKFTSLQGRTVATSGQCNDTTW